MSDRPTIQADVAIVGGGPAGSTAARQLASSGLKVVVLDKVEHPRYKTCGGGLVARARKLIDLPLGDDVVEHECRTVALNLVDTGLALRVSRTRPLVTMAMRSALDRHLLDAATDAGATLAAPFEVISVDQGAGEVELESRCGRRCRALHVIAADGALSPTAKAAGWPTAASGIPALESEIQVDASTYTRLRDVARFDFEVVSDGYAWSFPKRRHLSVGVLSTRRGKGGLRQALDRYLGTLGITEILARDDHGYVIPTQPRPGGAARQRVLLIGDAAGLADPLTGEGISHAVLSGHLAAEAVLAHTGDVDRVRKTYLAALEREILSELRIAGRLARLIYRHPKLRRTGFSRIGQRLCEAMTAIISGESTYRDLFRQPGNYAKLVNALVQGPPQKTADVVGPPRSKNRDA